MNNVWGLSGAWRTNFTDVTPPVLTLIGGNAVVLVGTLYKEQGYSASDNVDGDITYRVWSVIPATNVVGLFYIDYYVFDNVANLTKVSRPLIVSSGYTPIPEEEFIMYDISDYPWAEFSLTENRTQFVLDTLSLRRKKRGKGHHRYEIELVTIDMPMDQGRDIKARLSDAYDAKLTFIHPRLGFSRGTEPEEGITSNNNYAKGLREIALTSEGTWQMKSGDIFTFANHTKVYEIVGSTELKNGTSVIRLSSQLQKAVVQGEEITVNGVAWTLISDSVIEVSTEASENQDMKLVLNAVEDLSF
jgi:hypothetical protein